MKLQAGKKQQVFSSCTLKELCPEDKQKVAKLVKQIVELGQENQHLKDAAVKASAAAEEKVKQIQECNKQAVKENCSLKTKLGQAVAVLRMYHHKVRGLDAALRAMQHSAAAPGNLTDQQQQQQQEPHVPQQQATKLATGQEPASAASAAGGSTDQQQQQRSPGSVSSSPAHPTAEQQGLPASAAAARLQQQAQQLSELLAQGDVAPAVPAAPAAAAGQQSAGEQLFQTPSISQQQQQQQAAHSPQAGRGAAAGTAADAGAGADALPTVAPLVLSPHFASVREALQDLASWQLQQGLITPGQAADIVRHKVLQFDPSVGSHGAFVIQELPSVPPVGSSISGTAETAAAAIAGGNHLAAEQRSGLLAQLTLKLPERALSAVPAAVAAGAAAGAASSSRSSSVVPGLLDASPWESPTCKQLMDLAAAFDSLAAASTPGRATTCTVRSSPAAAGDAAASVSVPRLPDAASAAAAAAAAGGATGPLGVGVPCECGVEEVPVEALDAAQLPVLVQNEKSWSSALHAPSPTMAVAAGGGPLPIMAGVPVAPPQPQQQQHSYCSRDKDQLQPSLTGSWLQQEQPWQQQQQEEHSNWMQQPNQQGMQQQQPYQHSRSRATASPTDVPPAAGLVHNGGGWAPARHLQQQQNGVPNLCPAQQQPPEVYQHEPAEQQQQQLCAGGQWQQQQWQLGQPPMQQQQRPWQQVVLASSQPFSANPHSQQQLAVVETGTYGVAASASGAGLCLAAADARQLLERFDESLVDLLVEVERLEQQQQARRQRQQQQQQQQQSRQQQPHQPPRQQQQVAACWGGQQVMQHSFALQQQLQRHDQLASQHRLPGVCQPMLGVPGTHVQCWQSGGVAVLAQAEDDEVSDILNC